MIFISYRSSEPGWSVGIDQHLSARFGEGTVFRASRRISPGESYPDILRRAVLTARVVLVVIGPRWLAVEATGRRRIDEPGDWVRGEIRLALRADRPVVPVLVDGAPAPRAADLPADVRPMADLQYVRVDHKDATVSLDRLAARIEELVPELARPPAARAVAGAAVPQLPPPRDEDASAAVGGLDAALVRLRVRDRQDTPSAVGLLVAPHLVLTSAEAVDVASGPSRPGPGGPALAADLPLLAGDDRPAVPVDGVLPPDAAPGDQGTGAGGLLLLRLAGPLPGGVPAALARDRHRWEHAARAFGYREGGEGVWVAGTIRDVTAGGRVQVDLAVRNGSTPRLLGSPVWDAATRAVAGVLVQVDGAAAVGEMVPAESIAATWTAVGDAARPPSPFRGLLPFREEDAAAFHGRDRESAAVARAVSAEPWVTVVGPSGSGKSSLVLAGVLPRLRRDGACCLVLRAGACDPVGAALAAVALPLLEPGTAEVERLARAADLAALLHDAGGVTRLAARLLELTGCTRLVIVVDQLEEALLLPPGALDALARLLFAPGLPAYVRVLATARADFVDALLGHPVLGAALAGRLVALGPLTDQALREILTAPLATVPGARYEDHLVDRILADAGTDPGMLPLLSFTLDQLWRDGAGVLTHARYSQLGGVTGALARHAERTWAEQVGDLPEEPARRLLTRLCRLPLDASATTPAVRRTVRRGELGDREWELAQRLAAARLLVTSRDHEGVETVELVHEALLTRWSRLAAWVAEDRAFLTWRESLRYDLQRWQAGGRTDDLLPTGASLSAARQWSDRAEWLSPDESGFLDRGRARERTRRRAGRVLRAVVASAAAVTLLLAGVVVAQRQAAGRQRALADSIALAQASADRSSDDPALAALLAVAAYRRSPTPAAGSQLLRRYLSTRPVTSLVSGTPGRLVRHVLSRDGNVLVTRTLLGRATLVVDALRGRQRRLRLSPDKQVVESAVSADGSRIVLVRVDGSVHRYDVRPGTADLVGPVHVLPGVAPPADGEEAQAALSPDGRSLLVAEPGGLLTWWDVDAGTVRARRPTPSWFTRGGELAFLDDAHVVIEDSDAPAMAGWAVLDLRTGAVRVRMVPRTDDVGLSGDGRVAVTCAKEKGAVRLVAYRTGDGKQTAPPVRLPRTFAVCPYRLAVDAAGGRVIVTDSDTVAELVDLRTGTVSARAVLVTPYAIASDRRPSLLGLVPSEPPLVAQGSDTSVTFTALTQAAATPVLVAALSPQGDRLVTASSRGRLQHLPVEADQAVPEESGVIAPSDRDDTRRLIFSASGRYLAVQGNDGRIRLEDARTLRLVGTVAPEMPAAAFDPDDAPMRFDAQDRLVTTRGTVLERWDVTTGRRTARLDLAAVVAGDPGTGAYASEGGDGRVLVHRWDSGIVHVVDLGTGRTESIVRLPEDLISVKVDGGGRYLAVLRHGGIVDLWTRTAPPRLAMTLPVVVGESQRPFTTQLLADGGFEVADLDSVHVYHPDRPRQVDSYQLHPGEGWSVDALDRISFNFIAVSRDGRALLYRTNATGRGIYGVLRLDPAAWVRAVCARVGGREFTAEERASLPAEHVDAQVCPPPAT